MRRNTPQPSAEESKLRRVITLRYVNFETCVEVSWSVHSRECVYF